MVSLKTNFVSYLISLMISQLFTEKMWLPFYLNLSISGGKEGRE